MTVMSMLKLLQPRSGEGMLLTLLSQQLLMAHSGGEARGGACVEARGQPVRGVPECLHGLCLLATLLRFL